MKTQSVPAQGQAPQTFETASAILAKTDWNALPVMTGLVWTPKIGDKSVYLAGTATQLNPGDAFLSSETSALSKSRPAKIGTSGSSAR